MKKKIKVIFIIIIILLTLMIIVGGLYFAAIYLINKEINRIGNQGELLNKEKDISFYNKNINILYFIENETLIIRNLKSNIEINIHKNIRIVGWSPNGKFLTLRTSGKFASILIYNIDKNELIIIEKDIICDLPEWSPNSKKIVYEINDVDNASYKSNLIIYDLGTKNKNKITRAPNYLSDYKWDKSGEIIYYHQLFNNQSYSYLLSNKEILELPIVKNKDNLWEESIEIINIHFNNNNHSNTSDWESYSNDGTSYLHNIEGSLFLRKKGKKEDFLLVQFEGEYNCDFQPGIMNMTWLNKDSFVFTFNGLIYLYDLNQKKFGILAEGYNPITYLSTFNNREKREKLFNNK